MGANWFMAYIRMVMYILVFITSAFMYGASKTYNALAVGNIVYSLAMLTALFLSKFTDNPHFTDLGVVIMTVGTIMWGMFSLLQVIKYGMGNNKK